MRVLRALRVLRLSGMLLVTLLVLSVTISIQAQEGSGGDFTPNPELVAQMNRIEQITSDLRGLPGQKAITRKFPTRADVRAYLDQQVAGEENEKLYRDAGQFYVAFDLLPAGSDLLQIYLDFLGQQIGGYFDTDTKDMNVVLLSGKLPTHTLPVLEQITYSHEYTHALQDEYFDLGSLIDDQLSIENPDMAQARLSLVEGDATYVMNLYTVRITQEAPLLTLAQVLIQGAASGSLTIPEGTPAVIQNELLSPYMDGMNFVEALIDADNGGWEKVNQAYTDALPESTEQIIHPERYLAGDHPVDVALLPDDNTMGEGWSVLFERPLGEFYLREYLDTQLAPLDVIKAATGWGGDRYRLYYNAETDQRAWVMQLEWDTPEDAEQFADLYLQFGHLRFAGDAKANGCWSRAEDALCFAQVEGSSLISVAPTEDQALRLLESQRQPVPA